MDLPAALRRVASARTARQVFRRVLGARLPHTDGVLTLGGVRDEVTIARDAWHVPHIRAANEADAFYGLGFAQGQDRAFQIDVLTRLASGTLAALIGPEGLAPDRLTRRIGFWHLAQQQIDALDPRERGVLDAFARGVTDGATHGVPRPAHEYTLLRAAPAPLDAAHVLANLKLQAFLLAANWEHELARLKVLLDDGEEALRDLDPVYGAHLPVTAPVGAPAGETVDRLADDLALLTSRLGDGASNNWAVAGSRTASGRPLVANDPHLPPLLPPTWYLAHLVTPEWAVAGACLAGTPGFAAAHNGHGAWGATAAHTDNTDLFLEEVGPDGASVRDGDGWLPCRVRRETIEVRFARDVVVEVLETPRGPVVGPAVEGGFGALSMRGVWMHTSPGPGLLRLPQARTFEDFREALADSPGMQLNFVWGDDQGTIGWQLVGHLPRRTKGWGTLPLPGWDRGVGWHEELAPFEALPHLRDPDEGFVATANDRPVADHHADLFLGVDFLDGYRQAAIVEALGERDDWDVAATLALQLDVRSTPWRELRDVVLALDPADADARLALALLRAWDGQVEADAPAAAVYELTLAELVRRVVHARAPRSGAWFAGRSFSTIAPHSLLALRRTAHVLELVRDQPEGWFADGWPAQLEAALAAAIGQLRHEHGDRPEGWRWGNVRPLHLRHLVSEAAGPLRAVFDRGPLRIGGDAHTIPQASVPPLDPTANPFAIASARMVVPVGDWEQARWVLPGGQSGNPVSPHYDDQLPRWLAGEAIAIPWEATRVDAATRHTLRLLPARPPPDAP